MHKGHIYWNNKDSYDLGIIVEQVPNLNKPQRKYDTYTVPGRSGVIIEQQDAYDNIEKSYNIWFAVDKFYKDLYSPQKAAQVASWLYSVNGYSRLEDNFEPDIYRKAYFVGPLNIENHMQKYGICEITFNCRPEHYLKVGESFIENPNILRNPTTFNAKPLIKVEGSGNVYFIIQGQRVDITGLQDYIYLDCDAQDAYRQPAENKNSMITGNFPIIYPGDNSVVKSSGITKLSIQPNYWTL